MPRANSTSRRIPDAARLSVDVKPASKVPGIVVGAGGIVIRVRERAFEGAAKAMEDQFQGEYQRFAQLFADHSDGALNDKFDEDGGADGLREKLKNQATAKRYGKNGITSMLQYASLLLGYNETYSAMMLEWVSASLNVLDKYATHAKAA